MREEVEEADGLKYEGTTRRQHGGKDNAEWEDREKDACKQMERGGRGG